MTLPTLLQIAAERTGIDESELQTLPAAALVSMLKFGFRTQLGGQTGTFSITVAAVPIFGNNPRRVQWGIVNLGANSAFVAWERAVSASNGILIEATGGNWVSLADEDGEITAWQLFSSAPAGAVNAFRWEIEAAG